MSIKFLPSETADQNGEFRELQNLLEEISSHDLPEETLLEINQKTDRLESFGTPSKEASKRIAAVQEEILKLLREKHGLVPENHYASLWLPLGMSAFGLPFGVLLFAATDNPAFIAVGLPLGLGLGSLYGARLDQKAAAEGKILKFQKKEEKK